MSDPDNKSELLRSLGRVVRGLVILFWALPLALVVFGLLWIQALSFGARPSALTEWLQSLDVFPPVLTTGLIFYGLTQLGGFQPQERVWQAALDRAKVLSLINVGLSPFMFWWNRMPFVVFYSLAVGLLTVSALMFLATLNHLLNRLAAMLPDETLRVETKFFTTVNVYLLTAIVALMLGYFALLQLPTTPVFLLQLIEALELTRHWLVIFLLLLPVALTMTLIWKIKEAILSSVFGAE